MLDICPAYFILVHVFKKHLIAVLFKNQSKDIIVTSSKEDRTTTGVRNVASYAFTSIMTKGEVKPTALNYIGLLPQK